MEKIIKEGKELEGIIASICEEQNIEPEDLCYKYTTKKNGIFNKNVVYEVEAITKKDLVEFVKEYLSELTSNIGIDVNLETKMRDGAICIKMYSDSNQILIGHNGNTLKSLETIIKQKIQTEFGVRCLINLDVENYREKQEKRLIRLAKTLAKEVSQTKTETHLEAMNAYDRRIIHNALSEFKGVKTISEGEGLTRHVVIKPE